VLFEHRDFGGRSDVLYHDTPDLSRTSVGAYEASSVRVPRGCQVLLFSQPGYRGLGVRLTGSETYLGDTELGNDRLASIRVDCRGHWWNRPGGWDDEGRFGVTLYAEDDYRGASQSFDRDTNDLLDTRVGNDRASSVRVARGCRVTLYRDSDFRGAYVVLYGDTPALRLTPVGNDAASSLRVDCQ
jgi:hypothetical protein